MLLDKEDGTDWETFCDCSCLYAVLSAKLFGKRGRVTLERRRQTRGQTKELFLLNETG